jgi:hypothetical protein
MPHPLRRSEMTQTTIDPSSGVTPPEDIARMTTAAEVNVGISEVPLPTGADPENVDDWQTDDGVTSRLVWSQREPLPDHLAHDVLVVASQLTDGSIVSGNALEGPFVYCSGEDYSVADARAIAQALMNAADLADRWTSSAKGAVDTRLPQFSERLLEAAEVIESMANEPVSDDGGNLPTSVISDCSACRYEAEQWAGR